MISDWDNRELNWRKRKEAIKQEVLTLTLPNEERDALPRNRIAKIVNRSESTVYHLQRELIKEGKLQVNDNTGQIIRDKPAVAVQSFNDISRTNFIKYASIKRWIEYMKRNGVKKYRIYVVNMWKICKTLDKHPDAFLESIDMVDNYKNDFVTMFKEGKAISVYKKKQKDPVQQSRANPVDYIKAIRSFRDGNQKENTKGYLTYDDKSSEIYSRVQLSDSEFKEAITFMANFGKTIYTLFLLQFELGVRIETLLELKPFWESKTTTVDEIDCTYLKCIVYEKKQKKHFEKLIFTPEAKEIASNLQNGQLIYQTQNQQKLLSEYYQRLRELYAYLGKISKDPMIQTNYENGTLEWYYVNRPSHVSRHSCVHKLMRMSGFRSDVVASLFWDEPDTLKIYSKQTLDELLQQGRCDYCNPGNVNDNQNFIFCSLQHAMVFQNNGGLAKV